MNNLNEDIKILEDYIYNKKETMKEQLVKAIESVLKERQQDKEKIKELEEENKELKPCKYSIDFYELGKKNQRNRIELDYIPVSLVEETIEELDIKITYIESQYTNGGQNCNSNYLGALYQKQVLEELLKGE